MISKLHAFFGGTFDPIHFGHLYSAQALATQIGLDHVWLLPNNIPPHRLQPEASSDQRLEMIRYAIQNLPIFDINTSELEKEGSSWIVDT
jgi:nicotinate-nucleotide adenylyltransferase